MGAPTDAIAALEGGLSLSPADSEIRATIEAIKSSPAGAPVRQDVQRALEHARTEAKAEVAVHSAA
jgi:hypothetical protein